MDILVKSEQYLFSGGVMNSLRLAFFYFTIASFLSTTNSNNSPSVLAAAQTKTNVQIVILNKANQPIDQLVDGNKIYLRIENLEPVSDQRQVAFFLDSNIQISTCEVPPGDTACETPGVTTLGWYWESGGVAKVSRQITAQIDSVNNPLLVTNFFMMPRPVVLVHGFISDYSAFTNYLGPQGYLARVGLHGYAVGDGQVQGVMDTGSIDSPQKRTNTILQNANVLAQYIEGVKSQTNAEMVDLVVHSMGGLISRAYIDQVMTDRDVAQLIMLGSPMGGTDCSNLPAALGFYLPATIEIRPSYVRNIFNLQVTHRKGIAFYDLAGTSILEGFKSPCTDIPNDLVVSLESVNAIPIHSEQMPVLHIDLNTSEVVFDEFVLPKLQTPAGSFKDDPDPVLSGQATQPVQFTRMYTGFLQSGGSAELAIQIDAGVSVASFALYDSSRSLAVTVRGASGNEIQLNAEQNGLIIVDDPSLMFYLGYGFNNPRPGAWLVRLETTERTPPTGTAYALSANFTGGAILDAQATPLIPAFGTTVTLSSRLELDGQAIEISSANASIRQPDGRTTTIELEPQGDGYRVEWEPQQEGLHGIDILVTGKDDTGLLIERTAFLAVEVLPSKAPTYISLLGFGLLTVILIIIVSASIIRLAIRKHKNN